MANTSVATIPPPFSYAPSQLFDGIDGSWSTFIVRVGTPSQSFRVLPSTAGQEVWVPLNDSCKPTDPANCGYLRGGYPFDQRGFGYDFNSSSTWQQIGIYQFYLHTAFNMTGNGQFGFDNVGLQVENSGGLELKNQVVAGFVTQRYWLGLFGLGMKGSNFTTFDHPVPSPLKVLRDENKIPSLSFAYTAGASYTTPKTYGSLTLGGYDAARIQDSSINASFPFDPNDSKPFSVGVQRITATNTLSDPVNGLMTDAIYSTIDSTLPQIWLPRKTCDDFEQAFGLTFDRRTGLYLVNDTIHARLQELKPTVTFSLANTNDVTKYVNIKLPYAALDLQASWPYYNSTTNYFPIRRADNDTQYALGRAFLQEAYLVADYERSNFSIHQARLDFASSGPQQQIVSILSPSYQNSAIANQTTSASKSTRLSTGAIAGISIGSVAFAASLLVFLFLFLRRRSKAAELDNTQQQNSEGKEDYSAEKRASLYHMHEMFEPPAEVVGDKVQYEADSKALYMLSDDKSDVDVKDKPLPDVPMIFEMSVDRDSRVGANEQDEVVVVKYGGNWI